MMGTTTAEVVALAVEQGAAAVGANCGTSLEAMAEIVAELSAAAGTLPLWVKPNAGLPRMTGDGAVYDVTPELLGEAARGYVAGRRAHRRRLLRVDARPRARHRRGDQAPVEAPTAFAKAARAASPKSTKRTSSISRRSARAERTAATATAAASSTG